jgi:hypothetical protein
MLKSKKNMHAEKNATNSKFGQFSHKKWYILGQNQAKKSPR